MTAKKIDDGLYEYRGYELEREPSRPGEKPGKWQIFGLSGGVVTKPTLKECKRVIDKEIGV